MKKLIQLSMLIMALAFVFVTPVLAQATDPVDPNPIDIPGYFVSLATVSGLALVLTALVTKQLDINSTGKQIISWVIAVAIAFVGYFFQVGIFVETNALWTAVLGLAAGLMANGTYDVKVIQGILEFLKLKIPTTRK